jgi:AcrR family transcriptional regulator
MANNAAKSPERRGRPRDPLIDAAISKAVIELLRDGGYADVTMDSVAQRAGIGHTSIYRRWPSKAHMVHEVVFPDELHHANEPDASFEDCVRGWATGVIDTLSRPEVRAALPGILADAQADPELLRRLVARFEPRERDTFRRTAAAAAERGEIRDDVDVDRLFDAVIGAAMALPYFTHRLSRRRYAESLVDLLLNGVWPRTTGRR